MNLLVKPKKNSQEIVSVSPESAGWRYVSFSAHQLAPGETLSFSDNSTELCVVVLTGIVSAQTDGFDWKGIGGRLSVFEDAFPYAVYLPPRAKLAVTAKTTVELGVAGAPAKGELPVRLIESCYFNVMAGPKRVWHFHNDPAHEWIVSRKGTDPQNFHLKGRCLE
jgi:5-deoxy-glucuronate isomerase